MANMPRRKPKVLRPVHASQGLECEYRRRIQCLIEEMDNSVKYWLRASYKANEPVIKDDDLQVHDLAQDSMIVSASEATRYLGSNNPRQQVLIRAGRLAAKANTDGCPGSIPEGASDAALPANALRRSVRRLARQWQRRFNDSAKDLAEWFARSTRNRSIEQLHRILKRGGWSVRLRLTQAQRDVLQAIVHENVSLIKSIPQHYFTQVEGMVMRSVQSGRDLHQLTADLQRNFGVTKRRATFIARDQNNKATGALNRVHQIELGITQAIWQHSHAGKKPRPTHVAMDGKRYDVRKGMYDSHERKWVIPGELPNCRCFSVSVIPGFS